jgi:hypothetical protein
VVVVGFILALNWGVMEVTDIIRACFGHETTLDLIIRGRVGDEWDGSGIGETARGVGRG